MSFAPTLAFMLIRFYEQPSYRTNMQMKQHVEHFFTLNFFCCSSFSMPFGFCSLELIFAIFVGQVCAFLYKPKQKKNREDIANEKATSTLLLPSLILVSAISFMMPNLMNLLHSQKRTYQKNRIERSRKKKIPKRKTVSPKGLSLSR